MAESERNVKVNLSMPNEFSKMLFLHDKGLYKNYQAFNESRVSKHMAFFFVLFFTLGTVPLYLVNYLTFESPFANVTDVISIVLEVAANIVGWFLLFAKFGSKRNKAWIPPRIMKRLRHVESTFLVLLTALLSFRLLLRCGTGQCPPRSSTFNCNPHRQSFGLPMDSMVALMLLPLAYAVVLRDTSWAVVFACWIAVVISLIAAIIISRAGSAAAGVLIYIPFSFQILYDNQRENLTMFLLTMRLVKTMQQTELRQAESHAHEMRSLIGNVAHDLKTPLTSFLNGIEIISQEIQASKERILTNCMDNQTMKISLSAIYDAVTNMRNTNSFMIMTINRCIDFTKASKGLKLVAKPDTIDLRETLSLPLNVMKDMQSRVVITMFPIPPQICSHIITDKQWLQENVLCLLSNAVKYSNRGLVTIRVELINPNANKKPPSESSNLQMLLNTVHFPAKKIVPTNGTSERYEAVEDEVVANSTQLKPFHRRGTDELEIRPDDDEGGLLPGVGMTYDEQSTQPQLRFEIEDTGIGLSEEAMENLFNPFKQAQRFAGGTGLGLYSLAKRIEAIKGSFGVMRRRDGQEGSLFWFSIPYLADENAASESTGTEKLFDLGAISQEHLPVTDDVLRLRSMSENEKVRSVSVRGEREISISISESRKDNVPATPAVNKVRSTDQLRILLVDDSVPILKMTSMMLKRQGHQVTQAENGAEALEKLSSLKADSLYDVVLMDLQMPVMDGLESTRRLRKIESKYNELMRQQQQSREECKVRSGAEEDHLEVMSVNDELASNSPRAVPPRHQFIIGVSANSDYDAMQDAYKAGVDAFMGKPFSLQNFNEVYTRMKENAYENFLNNTSQLAQLTQQQQQQK